MKTKNIEVHGKAYEAKYGYPNAEKEKAIVFELVLYISFAALVCIVLTQSSFFPSSGIYPLTDSSVFQLVGTLITEGQAPYTDIFDHKGALLYILNSIGLLISPSKGILIIEFISLYATAILWYQTALTFRITKFNSAIIVYILLIAVSSTLEGGNLVEEYCLPYITFTVYAFSRTIVLKKNSFTLFILMGFSMACVFMLKFPSIAIQVPFVIGSLITLKRNKMKTTVSLVSLTIGICFLFIPVLTWLFYLNALSDFVFDYFIYNSQYAGHASIAERVNSLSFFLSNFMIICSIVLTAFCLIVTKNNYLPLIVNILSLILGLFIVGATGYKYLHYLLFFIPCYLIPLSLFIKTLQIYHPKTQIIIKTVCTFILLLQFILPCVVTTSNFIVSQQEATKSKSSLIDYLKSQGIKADDNIQVIGNSCWIYLKTDTHPSSALAYLPAYISDSTPWLNEIVSSMEVKHPTAILVDTNRFPNFDEYQNNTCQFIDDNYVLTSNVYEHDVYIAKCLLQSETSSS